MQNEDIYMGSLLSKVIDINVTKGFAIRCKCWVFIGMPFLMFMIFFYSRKKISSWKSITIILTPVCLLGWKPPYPGISLKLNTLLNITHKNPLQSMASVVFTVPDSIRERERICEQTIYYSHKTQSICLLFQLAHQKSRSPFAHLQSYNRLLLDHVLHEQPL